MADFWNSKYKEYDWAYGRTPNDFVVESLSSFKTEHEIIKVLSVGEGEGRNAIYVAQLLKTLGKEYKVEAIDLSTVACEKLSSWAQELGLNITTKVMDLADFVWNENEYDIILSIWCHTPSILRKQWHAKISSALKSDGIFILEAYTPENIGLGTGGPQLPDLCVKESDLRVELSELQILILKSNQRDIQEGALHHGLSFTVQACAKSKKIKNGC
jgi:hypothetical protein